jgi:ligand-binding sensor domain-containing protein/signal transduction histidine kinase
MFLEQCLFSIFIFRQSKYVLMALLLLSIEAATFSYAQNSDLNFKSLNSKNGLLGDVNAFMFKDSRGFMWFSSVQGLNRFDGTHVKTYNYDPSKTHSLRGNNIQSNFFEDKKGDIWFCTEDAINVYRRQQDNFEYFQVHDAKGYLLQNDYYIFDLDELGVLWLRVGAYKNGNLYRFNTSDNKEEQLNGLSSKTHRETRLGNFIGLRTVVEKKAGETNLLSFFWSDQFGLVEYKYNKQYEFVGTQSYFSGEKNDAFSPKDTFKIRQIVYDSLAKGFWIATQRGLVFWNKNEEKYFVFNTFENKMVGTLTDIVIRNDSVLVSSRTHGILVFDKNTYKFIYQIIPKRVDTEGGHLVNYDNLFLDKEDNLWLSNFTNGLFYTNLKRPKFGLLHFVTTNLSVLTDNIIEDNKGNKWIASRGEGITVVNPKRKIMSNFFSKNLTGFIISLFCDNQNIIWALTTGTHPALYCFNPQKRLFDKVNFAGNQSFDGIQFYDMCQISDGRLLIGSSKGVFEVDKWAKSLVLKKCSIEGINESDWNVVDIFEDQYKTIYFNQNSQNLVMCRLEGKLIRKINEVSVNGETTGFIEHNNQLWLSSNKGLLVFDHAFEKLTSPRAYLVGVVVNGVLKDSTGHFWLGTSYGMLNFDPLTGNYRRFSTADLMQGYRFGLSALADRDGYFWFGGTNGINVFKPSEVRNFPFAPRPHITDILVNNAPYRPDTSIIEKKRLVLPYDSNTVRLDFTAVEYSDAPSDSISYTFNLADLDSTKWVWTTTANAAAPSVSYINLREGDYVLRFKAVNSDGVWSETRILELHILPPWHRTWWFYTFLIALGLGITYAVVRKVIAFREKQLKAQAAFEQKIKETELQVLRLQMNPHFIFSALNSIRAYVLNKDSDAASKFLADFAHLMRQILQYSTEESITLEKEEALLRGYLEMEQLRFDFDFDIQIADDLDTFDTEVPPMILQPFVENAILHGIASKRDDKGAILVRFDREDNNVLCSVQDNGLGMGNSLRKKHKDHESKSRAITQDRLDIITQLTGKPTALIYENVETGGTKVTIRLPINLGNLDD